MQFISNEQYQKAQQDVKAFEERQARYETFRQELGIRLQDFEVFNFKRKGNRIIFAGCIINENNNVKVLIGESECKTTEDEFDAMLGKLIAVRKAMKLNIDDIIDIVEPKNTSGYIYHNFITNETYEGEPINKIFTTISDKMKISGVTI